MKWLFTFNIQIWLGLKERDTGRIHTIEEVYNICQQHCDRVSDCVTVTPTRYIYKHGFEDGVMIGWIRYPRFPMPPHKMIKKALTLAKTLMVEFGQYKVSVVTRFKTFMLENDTV